MAEPHRLHELFDSAIDLPPAERAAFVAAACGDDPALRAALERWLRADASLGTFLETPPPLIAEARPENIADAAPRSFGPWRVLRSLGVGGMGEVWLAERADGEYEQRVAIKQVAWPTPGLLQRFRRERQILARLEHPNIAHLIDGGVDANGSPYFAMEYIEGAPVTAYAQAHALSVRACVALMLQICEGVRYAHQNLIVHRDLKPSNILVSADGVPKLLDFGIAKILAASEIDSAPATGTGQHLLTLDYAAPEQYRGAAVTTATDVYALGVVLHELLTGLRPFARAGEGAARMQAVLHEEPALPSAGVEAKFADAAARRRALRGDLDSILLTALARDPQRRYASAEAFAADLRNYLEGRPVGARGHGNFYTLRKFAVRNRAGVAAAVVAAVALVAGLAVALAQRQAALRERDEAERQTAVAEAVKNFLNEDVIRAASPFLKTSLKDVTVREAIERGAGKIDGRFKGQPAVELETRIELGALFLQIGEPDRAEAQYRAAVQLGSASIDVPAAKAQLARYSLAQALAQRSKNDEAKTLLEATDKLAQAQDERDARLSSTRNSAWGTYYYHLGNPLKALPYYERSVADFIRWQPDNELVLASRMINLASVKLTTGDIEAGERGVREAMASLERSDGKQTFGYGMALSLLGRMRFFRHDYAGAEQLCTQAATMLRAILGGDVAFVADAVTILSRLQTATGRYAEAADSARLVYEAYLSSIGATGFNTQVYRMFLGHAEYLAGQRELGLKTSEEGLVALSAIVPPDHISLQLMKFHLASDYLDFGASRSSAARTIVDALDVDALQRISPEGDWPARLAALRGQIAFYAGDRERARGLLEPAVATMTQMNSARFEIERAQRVLQKLDDGGR